jgi:LysM repeat protein
MQTYIVKLGDTLSKISEMFYGNWSGVDAIAKTNGITNVNLIQVGQSLSIPDRPGVTNSTSSTVTEAQVIDEAGSGSKKWIWFGLFVVAGVGGYYYYKNKKAKKNKKA